MCVRAPRVYVEISLGLAQPSSLRWLLRLGPSLCLRALPDPRRRPKPHSLVYSPGGRHPLLHTVIMVTQSPQSSLALGFRNPPFAPVKKRGLPGACRTCMACMAMRPSSMCCSCASSAAGSSPASSAALCSRSAASLAAALSPSAACICSAVPSRSRLLECPQHNLLLKPAETFMVHWPIQIGDSCIRTLGHYK